MRSKQARPRQRELEFRTWGGARKGVGPKPAGDRERAPHAAREEVRPYQPVHVSMRMAAHVWNLRSQRSFRVVHFAILGNHLHVIAEADGTRAFTRGVRALAIRVARGLNHMMGRTGPVFADRYDAHELRTPAEVRNAVRYVVGNFESHAVRRGELRSTTGWVDPFSSAAAKGPREAHVSRSLQHATKPTAARCPDRPGRGVPAPGVRRLTTPGERVRPRLGDRTGARFIGCFLHVNAP